MLLFKTFGSQFVWFATNHDLHVALVVKGLIDDFFVFFLS